MSLEATAIHCPVSTQSCALHVRAVAVLATNPVTINPKTGEEVRWRIGAFEVTDESDGMVMFSKLKTGMYVSPKSDGTRPEEVSVTTVAHISGSSRHFRDGHSVQRAQPAV